MMKEQAEGETGRWVPIAGREGGTVTALALSPDFETDGLAFAATAAGAFRSEDGGRSWSPCGRGLTTPFIETVAVSPSFARDHTIFLGARDGTVLRSTDGGERWVSLGWLGERSPVIALAVSPQYSEDGTIIAGTFEDGVFRSRDRGATWASSSFGLLDLSVIALAISPSFAQDETIFVATASGIYRSRNGGRSWREAGLGDELVVQALAVSPDFAADRTIFAGTEENGLYHSTDGGDTFQHVGPETDGLCVNALAISRRFAQDRTLAAATSAGMLLSTDGGESWQAADAQTADALCLAAGTTSSGGLLLLAGLHREGALRSADGGNTWHPANEGLIAGSILGMALSPDFPRDQTLFCWGLEEGLLRSGDGGRGWQGAEVGIESNQIASVVVSPGFPVDGTLFAATGIGVYRSDDRGATWFATGLINRQAQSLALSPAFTRDGGVVTIAEGHLHASHDGGRNWEQFETPFKDEEMLAVELSPDYGADRALYVATRVEGPRGEPGRAQVWRGIRHNLSSPRPEGREASVRWESLFSQDDVGGRVAFTLPPTLASDGIFFVGTGSRVYRPLRGTRETTPQGQGPIWVSEGVGQADITLVVIAASPDFGRDRTIFAATSDGVYRSRNGGVSWEEMSNGLARRSVIAVVPSPHYAEDRAVYALTLGGQVWRYKQP
ncbi:MAG: hypothetical protein M1274_03710 [Actinobacteria bacterium]|nr:hypothetical protein [Actinomycetota bacterium]